MMDRRIVFMGTPPFAVASLAALVKDGVDVAAVVTAPDRPAGRGQQVRTSAVKDHALADPLLRDRILQPERLRDPAFLAQLDRANAPLYVVVAFRMLPETVWQRPRLGTINLHASLLPDYRGAAPINWAVMNGEQRTGATTFFLRHEIDTGDLIEQEATPIGAEETAGELHDRLMRIGAEMLVRSVNGIFAGTAARIPQTSLPGPLHHAPKLDPATCRIDWSRSVLQVHDHVRGLSPSPSAWSTFMLHRAPVRTKVHRTRLSDRTAQAAIGSAEAEGGHLYVRCGDGWIEILELQPEGRRRMFVHEFLPGVRQGAELLFQ